MKKEIADIWVAGLRSGNYEQGTNNLNKDNKFCCLGVLCDLAIKNGLDLAVNIAPDYTVKYGNSNAVLSSKVILWAGMNSVNGYIIGKGCLSEMNDGGMSFNDIGNLIEENWEKL